MLIQEAEYENRKLILQSKTFFKLCVRESAFVMPLRLSRTKHHLFKLDLQPTEKSALKLKIHVSV